MPWVRHFNLLSILYCLLITIVGCGPDPEPPQSTPINKPVYHDNNKPSAETAFKVYEAFKATYGIINSLPDSKNINSIQFNPPFLNSTKALKENCNVVTTKAHKDLKHLVFNQSFTVKSKSKECPIEFSVNVNSQSKRSNHRTISKIDFIAHLKTKTLVELPFNFINRFELSGNSIKETTLTSKSSGYSIIIENFKGDMDTIYPAASIEYSSKLRIKWKKKRTTTFTGEVDYQIKSDGVINKITEIYSVDKSGQLNVKIKLNKQHVKNITLLPSNI